MSELTRFGVSVEDELLQSYDQLIERQGYGNRSEALRDLMRDALVRSKLDAATATSGKESVNVIGTLTLVYDHHASDLSDKMNELQHKYYDLIISVVHVHISHDDCLEVVVLRGDVRNVRSIAEGLLSLKGVKHGKLFVTLPAGKIADRNDLHKH
jgi:CopG family nickel-responsive transcriptional regulator